MGLLATRRAAIPARGCSIHFVDLKTTVKVGSTKKASKGRIIHVENNTGVQERRRRGLALLDNALSVLKGSAKRPETHLGSCPSLRGAVLSQSLCSHPESDFWLNFPKVSLPFSFRCLGISTLVSLHSRVDSTLETATSSYVHFLLPSLGPSNPFCLLLSVLLLWPMCTGGPHGVVGVLLLWPLCTHRRTAQCSG